MFDYRQIIGHMGEIKMFDFCEKWSFFGDF